MIRCKNIIGKRTKNREKEGFYAKSNDIAVVDKHLVRLSSPPEDTRPGLLIRIKSKDNLNNKAVNR